MSVSHVVEYSKTAKARCHGAICNGKTMDLGALRYGRVTKGPYGESVQWKHWGCVTPDILIELGGSNIESTLGFKKLKPADQRKVRLAVASRRIAAEDLTSASPSNASGTPAPPGSVLGVANIPAKRKADDSPNDMSGSGVRNAGDKGKQRAAASVLDVFEEPDRGLDNQPAESVDELYCMVQSSVVGMQYYTGMVGPGEEVTLQREPTNPYDRNAIRVLNIGGVQVGHLPRDVAGRLSPLLDRKLINLEGVIVGGAPRRGKAYTVPITLKIYGASDKRPMLESELLWAAPRGFPRPGPNGERAIPGAPASMANRNGLPQAGAVPAMGGYIAGPSSSQIQAAAIIGAIGAGPSQNRITEAQLEALRQANTLRQMLNNLEKVDDGSRRESLLDTLCSTEDVLKLPEHKDPPGIANGDLEVDLLKHQKQALQWCIDREYPELPKTEADKPVQFWIYKKLDGRPCYYNIVTKTPQVTPPELGRGALCADSMGLGKTLTMIALILATLKDVPTDFSRTTLIIVPLSVLSNWETQIKEHCAQGSLSYYVYYGTARGISSHELKKYDVVITTYQVATKEFTDGVEPMLQEEMLASMGVKSGPSNSKKQKKGLPTMYAVQWKRIILDEGHTVRNPKTKTAQAVFELPAQRRWVVTGTPIINSPKDLGSILSFLKICKPLDNDDYFNRLLIRPLKVGSPEGCELLRAVMSQICIRRTKEMQDSSGKPLVPLPPVDMTMIRVPLEGRARELYDVVETLSRECFRQHMEETGGETVPTNVLGMLTRLRQLALHPGLVPSRYVDELRNRDMSVARGPRPAIKLKPQDKFKLQAVLAKLIEDCEECPICFGTLNDPRITSCSHAFCLACITEVIQRDPKCPMDRRAITMGDLIEPLPPSELTQVPPPLDEDEEEDDDEFRNGSSAKIDHLIYLLRSIPTNEKSLVFSQFTSFLDKIAAVLELHGISYVRFDGQMSAKRRQEVITQFCRPLDDDEAPIPPPPTPSSELEDINERPRRTSSRSTSVSHETSANASTLGDDDDDKDKDYVDNAKDDDDDDFLDGDADLSAWIQKKAKSKGKAKAKPKMKSRASSSRTSLSGTGVYDGSAFAGENPRVLLISLKAGALGLNLTVANNVFLMDPWWQEGIESQAIDRCNRIGQTKKVMVYQLIAENTVESKVIDIQEKKKQLIKEAFSGMKGAETQRQRREARAQDLVEIFGMRNEYRRGRL